MGGGAWPFLVGGVICLLNCVNERDLNLLNRGVYIYIHFLLLLKETLYIKYKEV